MTSILDIFLSYQAEFFKAPQARKAWIASRQIGKSFTIAGILTYSALSKPGNLALCISVNSRSASEIVKKCQLFAEAVSKMSNGQIASSHSFDSIKFSNGSRILSLPSTADSLRGFTASCVCIDEFCFISNLEDIIQAISPTLSRDPNAQLVLTSTPAGKASFAYHLWEQALSSSAWHAQMTTIHDAISQGLEVDLSSLHTLCPDRQAFAQEYECMFSDSYGSMLDTSLLESYHTLPASARHWWLGADIGRKHDKTALVSVTQDNGIAYVDSIDVLDKVEYQAQLDKIAALDKAKHYTRGYIDEGGIGSMVAEQASKAISPKLKGLAFTSSSKTPMFEAIRDLAFRHKLKFRDSIIELAKADMQQVSRIVTADGNVRYQASRTDEGHGDITSALALAIAAFKDAQPSTSLPAASLASSRFGTSFSRLR